MFVKSFKPNERYLLNCIPKKCVFALTREKKLLRPEGPWGGMPKSPLPPQTPPLLIYQKGACAAPFNP